MPAKGDQESPGSLPPVAALRKLPPRGRVLGKSGVNTPLGPTEPTLVFVPSIYGNSNYGTVYYGGQWYVLLPPIMPPPAPPTPPVGTPPFNGPFPPLPPPATSSTPGLLGTLVPSGYNITPFLAEAVDYETLFVSWNPPTGPFLDFRLVRNRYGFPVDENDGVTLLDSGGNGYPGNNYFDSDVIPGTMHYYGVYILVQVGTAQVWYRAGLTAVLAVTNYDSSDIMLLGRIPEYYKIGDLSNPLELTTDFLGNSYLEQFMQVFGWGLDYLKTQLALTENVNNPNVIPVNWLVNLAATVGFPYYPETDAATMRDAVANQAYLVQSRGTLSGIEDIVTQLTGWGTDIRPGINMMLEDDQSAFTDPDYAAWNPDIAYNAGEIVAWGPGGNPDYFFQSTQNVNLDNTPPTTPTSNSWWTDVYYASNSTVLTNPTTGWLNTWEPLLDNMTLQTPPAGAFTERVGILTPPAVGIYTQNGLGLTNNSGSTSSIELRSISRSIADIEAGLTYPTRGQVIGDGIPVPFTLPRQAWYSWVEYFPGQVVSYEGLPYLALKASTGITPPINGVPTNEWQPVGYDSRIALMLSGWTGQNLTVAGVGGYAVTPYVLWFDETGTFISSVYIRTPNSGNTPAQLVFDPFALPSNWGTALGTPTIGTGVSWTASVSNFVNNAFVSGAAVPATVNTRTLEVINYFSANCNVGVTLASLPNGGFYGGLALRYASATSYIRVDQYAVVEINGAAVTQLTVHGTPFSAGDRMTVSCNGNIITVYRNSVEVSAVTTSFNNSATYFGIVVDSANIQPSGTVQPNATRLASRRPQAKRTGWTGGSYGTWGGCVLATTNVARGAPVYPQHGPARSHPAPLSLHGRVINRVGAYTTTPAQIIRRSQPTRARSGPGRRGVTR